MAEREFLDQADKISFPLIDGDPRSFSGGGELPRQGLADAGFMLGQESGFDPSDHFVRLHAYIRAGDQMRLDFRSDASGMSDTRFLFSFDAGTPFGTSVRATASSVSGGDPEPGKGEGYIVIGELSELDALGEGTFTLSGTLRVEPALLQSLAGATVSSLSVANAPRLCPTSCGSSASQEPDFVCAFIKDLSGVLRFSEGNNAVVSADRERNTIQLGAAVGAGLGEPCEDVIIDRDCNFTRGEDCESCDDFIKTVNGMQSPDGKLVLDNGIGIDIVNEPDAHRIRVTPRADLRACTASSSSSA